MSAPSPAYEFGVQLGLMRDQMIRVAQQIVAGFEAVNRAASAPAPEALAALRYRSRIADERRKGREYVRAEAQRVRRELGLPEVSR